MAGTGARKKTITSTSLLLRSAPGSQRRRSRHKLLRAASRTRSRRRLQRPRRTATTRGKLGKDGLRGEARLEPVDGHVVDLGANLEQKSLLRALEDEVWAVIQRLQRGNVPITPDEDVGDVLELGVDTGRRRLGVNRGRRSKRLESLAEVGEKGGRRRLRNCEELPREAQGGAKHHLRGGEADPLLGGGPEPEEDPRKLLVP